MATFTYPTNATIKKIAQVKMVTRTLDDPIFRYMPIVVKNTDTVTWEQKDNYRGLQNVRGIGGDFGRVQKTAANRYVVTPGYYGDFDVIDETELTRLRPIGTWGDVLDASDLVMESQEKLLSREYDRMINIGWTLFTTGTFSVQNAQGAVMHTDTFSLTAAPAFSDWSVVSTATPLSDMRQLTTLGRGKSVRFDSTATLFINQTSANYLFNNTNASDLNGKLVVNGNTATFIGLAEINRVLLQNNLPQIEIYEGGYEDENGVFQLHLPTDKGVLVGRRDDGASIAEFIQTRNASNPNSAPGPYDEVVESREGPKTISVYRGINYGPAIEFPSAVVTVAF